MILESEIREPSIEQVIGEYKSFFSDLSQRLSAVGIDIAGMPISHICYRVEGMPEYEEVRSRLMSFSKAFAEHPFGGRPVAEFILKNPLDLGQGFSASVVELLPNKETRLYQRGLENIGVLVGSKLGEFKEKYGDILTGVKDRKESLQIPFITFENNRTVKFYDRSLVDIVKEDGFEFVQLSS